MTFQEKKILEAVFRTDASVEIGTGHVMRCMALADAMRVRSVLTRFVCRQLPESLASELKSRGHGVTLLPQRQVAPETKDGPQLAHATWLQASQWQDAEDTLAAMGKKCDFLVVDHYSLDARWESRLRAAAGKILVVDDLADRQHDCDLLLDQNFYFGMTARYAGKLPNRTRLLAGPRFALLRPEFTRLHATMKARSGTGTKMLVFMGGSDAANFTGLTIKALAKAALPNVRVYVVIGEQHPSRIAIEEECKRLGFFCHLQTLDMADLMAQADMGIGSGGSASWERCCLGLPTLTLTMADNQKQLVHDAAVEGLLHAPQFDAAKPEEFARHIAVFAASHFFREGISRRGMALVDGNGTARVLRALGLTSPTVRLAEPADSANLFAWRNHESVRTVSRNREPIDWKVHQTWMADVMSDQSRHLLIGELNGQAAGVVRFDVQGSSAEVSIYLCPRRHGNGAGSELLAAAEQWLASNLPDIISVRAEVIEDNIVSRRLFSGAGYVVSGINYIKGILHD